MSAIDLYELASTPYSRSVLPDLRISLGVKPMCCRTKNRKDELLYRRDLLAGAVEAKNPFLIPGEEGDKECNSCRYFKVCKPVQDDDTGVFSVNP